MLSTSVTAPYCKLLFCYFIIEFVFLKYTYHQYILIKRDSVEDKVSRLILGNTIQLDRYHL